MAMGTHLLQLAAERSGREVSFLGGIKESTEGEAISNVQLHPTTALPGSGMQTQRLQLPVGSFGISSTDQLLIHENLYLQSEVERLRKVVHISKVDTAELCSKFGELATDWAETVKELNKIHESQKKDYESRIGSLERTNEQLLKENNEMKKVIEDLKKMKFEFEKQKRKLKLGQIGLQLDTLVSEYVFPGDDRASKRSRYGTKLTSLKGKVNKIQDESMKENATRRLHDLNEEMFKDWFLGLVDDMKSSRVATAHPDLGTYEEMKEIINDEYKDDDDMRKDSLVVLEHLCEMYTLLNRQFGK